MKSQSPLNEIYKKGLYGDYENKNEENLIKIQEVSNLSIFQIVKYKNSKVSTNDLDVDGLKLSEKTNSVMTNGKTRILWLGPNNWLAVSEDKNLFHKVNKNAKETDFAITDLSNSRTIIEIEGKLIKEVLKKGCPFNFNELSKNNCINSVFHGITITIDMLEDSPEKIRLFALRSFGESFYHSITDASLEFGYQSI
jgi:heterotetrameric sarcosine oxidase gamma subunit